MSSSWENLVAKIGEPPYQLEHMYRLLHECQALMCALEGGHVVERDSVLTMFGIMEVMANFVVIQPGAIHSLYSYKPYASVLCNDMSDYELEEGLYCPVSFVRETLRCRQTVIEFLKLPDSSRGICQECNWTLVRMLRSERPVESRSRLNDQL